MSLTKFLSPRVLRWINSRLARKETLNSTNEIRPETLNIRCDDIYRWKDKTWVALSFTVSNSEGTLVNIRSEAKLCPNETMRIADIPNSLLHIELKVQ